ncbi:hypothetical protein F4781DRAFT_420102 [Annulohypoxylon bovei var. microspora]|nr:hypothetical protein F4781DRAFT_420102 [Annulohypoxylon bovei var. microspora]
MEMDMSGHDADYERGTKRKFAGDELDMTYHEEIAATADHRLPPATVSGCPFRDDQYYKALYLEEEPDFHLLGQRDPEFKAVLERGSHLDFANPKSVMQLTKTLLKLDFGLVVDLPTDRLCPPVPNRHNYIIWLKDLIDSTSSSTSCLDLGEPSRERPLWSFIATDVDSKSLSYARKNAQLNNMGSRIRVVDRTVTDRLIPLTELGLETIDFVMVNPPFYTSGAELADLASQKSRPPNSACTGAPIEMVCAGGEIGFIRRIIDESLVLREKVQWYTAMLGKQSSLEVLVGILKGYGVTNYVVTAFVQGNKTRRWAIGWSFQSRRPSLSASRGCEPSAGKRILPAPTEATVASWPMSRVKPEQLERTVCETMENLDLASWVWDRLHFRGVGFVDGNVWSRAYRRKKARENEKEDPNLDGEETTETNPPSSRQTYHCRTTDHSAAQYAFGFSVTIQVSKNIKNSEDQSVIVARWLQGDDYALFESFTGLLRKSIR